MVNRAQLRGKPLDKDCKRANTITNEYGTQDDRVFCYGLYEEPTDWLIKKKCLECKAFVNNAEPLKGGVE